jgi:hypothetical protein
VEVTVRARICDRLGDQPIDPEPARRSWRRILNRECDRAGGVVALASTVSRDDDCCQVAGRC